MPKITKRMASLLSAIVVGMSTVPAYAQSEVSVINHVGIGNVNIELTKSSLDKDGRKTALMMNRLFYLGRQWMRS